jgi:hypothetical protein
MRNDRFDNFNSERDIPRTSVEFIERSSFSIYCAYVQLKAILRPSELLQFSRRTRIGAILGLPQSELKERLLRANRSESGRSCVSQLL